MIPVKIYIGLFLCAGAFVFLISLASGQASGLLLGLFFLAWGGVAWFLKYGRSRDHLLGKSIGAAQAVNVGAQETGEVTFERSQASSGPVCLEGKVLSVQSLAGELQASSVAHFRCLGISESWLPDCIVDLELAGVFHRALEFLRDPPAATLFVDELLPQLTGQEPTAPEGMDVIAGLTHLYHGLGKYVVARNTIFVPDGDAPLWVFGMELAMAKGRPLDVLEIMGARQLAVEIRQDGFSLASKAFTRSASDSNARDGKPNPFRWGEYVVRPSIRRPSKFKDQPETYQQRVLASLKDLATSTKPPN